jgi:hypothetical protein
MPNPMPCRALAAAMSYTWLFDTASHTRLDATNSDPIASVYTAPSLLSNQPASAETIRGQPGYRRPGPRRGIRLADIRWRAIGANTRRNPGKFVTRT